MGTKYIEAAFKVNQKSAVAMNALCIKASQFADTLTLLKEGNLCAAWILHAEGSLMDATKYYTSATKVAWSYWGTWMHNDEIPTVIHTLDALIQPPNPQRSVEATTWVSSSDAAQEKIHACELFDHATRMLEHRDTCPNGNADIFTHAAAVTVDDLEMHLEVACFQLEEQPE
ncbi:hypothetical protein F5141DRAFT_1067742 [Pisolithus sp. B1]|nr:hypothetical protein F5141DRAFT_1067742 [Pisolithus sp. B1]